MANVNSLMSSTSSVKGLYGKKNIISGLASGMDTEAMIENAVSGIKTKIQSYQKKVTSVTWQQEAYRSIIDKMASLSDKYTSYASTNNLMSKAFFNNSYKVTATGDNASKISASGKGTSDVQMLGVKQLASAAKYVTTLGGAENPTITGGNMDLNAALSNTSGSLTIAKGDKSYTVNLDDTRYDTGADLVEAINKKLEEAGADAEGVQATLDGSGNLSFGADTKITGATGDIKGALGLEFDENNKEFESAAVDETKLTKAVGDVLSGAEISVTLNGKTKTIKMPELEKNADGTYKQDAGTNGNIVTSLNQSLEDAFGAGKITVSNADSSGNSLQLKFEVAEKGSTLSINSGVNEAMGLDKSATSYTNVSQTLGNSGFLTGLTATGQDKDGNDTYSFELNGKKIGDFTANSTISDVVNAINRSGAGVTASFSRTNNEFMFSANETGANGKIEFGGGLAERMFGKGKGAAGYTEGKDAVFSMSVNGTVYDGITRSDNSFEVDGMTMKLNGTFGEYNDSGKLADVNAAKQDAVSFKVATDTDKIYNQIKAFVDDYNAMVKELKSAYTTQPAYADSSYSKYEPLTDEEKADLSESQIKTYEEKAKQGLLYQDRNISSAYSALTRAVSRFGSGYGLKSIGIDTKYEDGLTTLEIDETKLRSAIESDPDKVRDTFAGTGYNGEGGVLAEVKNTLDKYAGTLGANKGILVQYAGSPKAPTSMLQNTLQTKLSQYEDQIEKWQNKYADKVDYYTSQFTQLEKLINQMNSQSSALAGLTGGY